MNEIVKKINDLKETLSYINFQSHLSKKDYELIESIEKTIDELEKQIKNVKLVCVKIKDNWYLTADSNLCFSTSPTWFDDIEEAKEYLKKADMFEKDKQKAKFIEKEF